MLRPIILITFLLSATHNCLAQKWDVSIGAGLPFSRILRTGASDKSTAYLQFGFMGPGSYLNPEVGIWLNDQGRFSFDYQVSNNKAGIQFGGNSKESSYNFFTLHTFCVGYTYQFTGFKGLAKFGLLGKAGITYGYNTGNGSGTTGGSARSQQVYAQIERIPNDNAMPAFWMPVLAAGFTLGPVIESKPAISDRIDITVTGVLGLKDMYADYERVKYAILTPNSREEGVAQYRGRPFTLQLGIKYRLFRIIRDR